MPYRRDADKSNSEPSGDAGIIDDLVQQFAHPFACLRELVQNAIDADATKIRVRVTQEGGLAIVSVRDDGEGMDPDTLENQLFVLFKSSKEGQKDKIGKFGVGFVSVFALSPDEVTVTTSRGTGRSWTGVLTSDHHYEIFERAGGTSAGTSVTLDVPLRGEFNDFVASAHESLVRWCRHSGIPIEFGAEGQLDSSIDVRIDRPLDLPGAWCVVEEERGSTRVLVGASETPFAGFYSHGLTLYEAPAVLPLYEIAYKVQDSRLEHTMSRDDVRRDDHFEEAYGFVREVATKRLVPRMLDTLDGMEPKQFAKHIASARRVLESLKSTASVRFPRIHGGRIALTSNGTHAPRESALTRALVASGVDVFDGSGDLEPLLRRELGPSAHQTHAWFEVIEPTPHDALMLDAFLDTLARVARRPPSAHLVSVEGSASGREFFATAPGLLAAGDQKPPFRRLFRPPILLEASSLLVRSAREKAKTWPEVAGAILARAALQEFAELDLERDTRWVEHALESLE